MTLRALFPFLKIGIVIILYSCLFLSLITIVGIFALNFLVTTSTSYLSFVSWLTNSHSLRFVMIPVSTSRHVGNKFGLRHQDCLHNSKAYDQYSSQIMSKSLDQNERCPISNVEKRLENMLNLISRSPRTKSPIDQTAYGDKSCHKTLYMLANLRSRLIKLLRKLNSKGNYPDHNNFYEENDTVRRNKAENSPNRYEKGRACKEIYHGSSHGYPYFETGFQIVDCQHTQNIHEQITIIYVVDPHTKISNTELYTMTSKILYPKSLGNRRNPKTQQLRHNVINARNGGFTIHLFATKHLKVESHKFKSHNSHLHDKNNKSNNFKDENYEWFEVMDQIKTPFVLLAKNAIHLQATPNLSRLLFEAEHQQFDGVGGAVKLKNGSWYLNCYQMKLKDYQLTIEPGYLRSDRECLDCDYFTGPALFRTSSLKNLYRRTKQTLPIFGSTFFEDLFLHLKSTKSRIGTCPDTMYGLSHLPFSQMEDNGIQTPPLDVTYSPLMNKWDLHEIYFPPTKISIKFSCDHKSDGMVIRCSRQDGDHVIHPCCRQYFHTMLAFVMDTCKDLKIPCEIQEGTLLGAVKLGSMLPWDRDGDIAFLSSAFTKLAYANAKFAQAGYKLLQASTPTCCVDSHVAGGKFIVQAMGMHIEMFGQHIMRKYEGLNAEVGIHNESASHETSNQILTDHTSPTKIMVAGRWMAGPENPGLHIRNRYGANVYKHTPHWMSAEMVDGWQTYQTFRFKACLLKPWHHACLDKIKIDGNIDVLG